MRISYQPTYAQFVENYLATYYSGGVSTLQRRAGGPALLLLGFLLIIAISNSLSPGFLSALLTIAASMLILWGLFLSLRPLLNVFLVRLRRDELFGDKTNPTTIELKKDLLEVTQNNENIHLPLSQIKSLQHRSQSTWILTEGDYLIFVPRHDLLEGDHDTFVSELEKLLEPDEEEE